ncbi:MAG: hypothetical protein ABI766_09660 [Gemmatimonadales bacterium]
MVFMLLAACGKSEPGRTGGDTPQTPAAAAAGTAQAAASSDPRAAIFLEKGCPQCHTISALGIKSQTEVGPDLTFAYTDVQSRFNVKLEEFLHNPTGTMQMVLSSQIKLSPEERDSVIHILKGLHEEAEKAEGHE